MNSLFCMMFNRQEASRVCQEFWTAFGKYMSPILSSEGSKVNWINYHTGVKDVYFRMDASNGLTSISISIEHNDPGIRELYFEQFLEFKTILHATLEEEWEWQQQVSINGRDICRIYKEIRGVSVLNKDQWPDLISFFKPRIIGLDDFWENARFSFEGLR
ncbi:MAG: DUF4268 domain-containing protein [Chryseolinea sp.]